jgi:hypothetical protein
MFLILILHSAGISSSVSSSLSTLNALATDGLGSGTAGFIELGTFSFICNFPDDGDVELLFDFKLIEIFEITGGGGTCIFSFLLCFEGFSSLSEDDELERERFLLLSKKIKNQ